MSCALGFGTGTPLHADLLMYCSDFNGSNFLAGFRAADWPGNYAPGLGTFLLSTLLVSGASVDCVVHLLACLGQHYDEALLAAVRPSMILHTLRPSGILRILLINSFRLVVRWKIG